MNSQTKFVLIIIALAVLVFRAQQLDVVGPLTPTDPTRITYVYDKDEPSRQIQFLLTKISEQGEILAAAVPLSGRTGTGGYPEQYAIARDAAKAAGPPCLVLQSDDKVLSTETDQSKMVQVLNGFHQLPD